MEREAWGEQESRVSSYNKPKKGKRYPIQWVESIERTGWYPNGMQHFVLMPSQYASNIEFPTEETFKVGTVMTWIFCRSVYREEWIIYDSKSEQSCVARDRVWP